MSRNRSRKSLTFGERSNAPFTARSRPWPMQTICSTGNNFSALTKLEPRSHVARKGMRLYDSNIDRINAKIDSDLCSAWVCIKPKHRTCNSQSALKKCAETEQ